MPLGLAWRHRFPPGAVPVQRQRRTASRFDLIVGEKSRARLVDWLVANKTGGERIRAGLPRGLKCGDKTGTGERGSTNDAAVIWPASGNPVLMSIYLTGTEQSLNGAALPRRRFHTHPAVPGRASTSSG
ncbi:hypothetical protein FJ527_08990 [Mesorhizobium sp. B2-4-18]|nr:hypothetical protein FJ527_08990 [Mesorhizobium sp. B2-4-18]